MLRKNTRSRSHLLKSPGKKYIYKKRYLLYDNDLFANSPNSLLQNLETRLDLLLRDSQRRDEPEASLSRSDDEQAPLARSCDQLRGLGDVSLGELETEDQAPTTDLLDHAGESLLQALEARQEDGRLGLDGLLQLGVRQTLDDVVRHAARERVSTEGGAVVTRLDVLADGGLGHNGRADGDAVAQGFGAGQDVRVRGLAVGGGQGRVSVCPQRARAGETALDLVEDENGADSVTARAKRGQELGSRDVDAALTLNGLNDDTARLVRDQGLQLSDVVVLPVLESRDHGSEGGLVLGVRGRGQSAHTPAVEGVVEGDELVLFAGGVQGASDLARELDGGLVGLGSGVGDEDGGGAAHGARLEGLLDEQLAEGAGPGIVVKVGCVDQGLRLDD